MINLKFVNCESKLWVVVGGEIIYFKEMVCLIRVVSRNNCYDNFDNVFRKYLV